MVYEEKFCFTPVGPCVEAKGPDPVKVAGMVVATAAIIYGGYRIAKAIDAKPSSRRRLR